MLDRSVKFLNTLGSSSFAFLRWIFLMPLAISMKYSRLLKTPCSAISILFLQGEIILTWSNMALIQILLISTPQILSLGSLLILISSFLSLYDDYSSFFNAAYPVRSYLSSITYLYALNSTSSIKQSTVLSWGSSEGSQPANRIFSLRNSLSCSLQAASSSSQYMAQISIKQFKNSVSNRQSD